MISIIVSLFINIISLLFIFNWEIKMDLKGFKGFKGLKGSKSSKQKNIMDYSFFALDSDYFKKEKPKNILWQVIKVSFFTDNNETIDVKDNTQFNLQYELVKKIPQTYDKTVFKYLSKPSYIEKLYIEQFQNMLKRWLFEKFKYPINEPITLKWDDMSKKCEVVLKGFWVNLVVHYIKKRSELNNLGYYPKLISVDEKLPEEQKEQENLIQEIETSIKNDIFKQTNVYHLLFAWKHYTAGLFDKDLNRYDEKINLLQQILDKNNNLSNYIKIYPGKQYIEKR